MLGLGNLRTSVLGREMHVIILKIYYLRVGHLERRGVFSLKLSVHENPVFSVACEIENPIFTKHLYVGSADKTRVSQVDIDLPLRGTVPADHNSVLSYQILEVFPVDFGNGRSDIFLHRDGLFLRRIRRVFKRQKRPGVARTVRFSDVCLRQSTRHVVTVAARINAVGRTHCCEPRPGESPHTG